MAVVGASCAGSLRWRVLGRATHILCPLHRRLRAGQPGSCTARSPAPRPKLGPPIATSSATRAPSPSAPSPATASSLPLPPSRLRRLPTTRRTVAITPAAHHAAAALLAATTTTTATAAPPAATTAAAATAAAAAAAGLPPGVAALIAILPSLGTFLLCLAAAVLLLASVPAVWALARAANRAERLMAAVEAELPDTAASMRLAGLELTDCVQELGALGGELTRGVRSTAALATAAEAGVRGGVAVADATFRNHVVPAVAKAERDAREAVEERLVATAKLSYTRPLVTQAAAAAATAVRRLRASLAVGRLAGAAVQAGRSAADALSRRQKQERRERDALYEQLDEQLLQQDEQALRAQLEALQEKHRRQQQQQQQRADQQPPQKL